LARVWIEEGDEQERIETWEYLRQVLDSGQKQEGEDDQQQTPKPWMEM